MSAPKITDSHNMDAFLAKPTESDEFKQILDFLNANPIKYALTINPTIYTSLDGKKVSITETSIRSDLQLEDAEGITCLPNADIFEQLALLGVKFLMYPRFVQVFLDKQVGDMSTHDGIFVTPSHTKKVSGNMKRVGKGFSRVVTSLFLTMMVQDQEEIGKGSANPTDPHHTPIITQLSTSKPQTKQKPRKPKRKDTEISQSSGPIEPIADEAANEENVPTHSNDPLLSGEDSLKLNDLMEIYEGLGDQEDASKQGRKIDDIDKDAEVTLVDKTQGRYDDAQMFDTDVFNGDEVFVAKQSEKVIEEVVSTGEVSAASTITTEEITLAQTLAELRSAKPMNCAPTPIVSSQQRTQVKEKGKGKMVEEEHVKKISKKELLKLDEELAFKLQAKEEEQARLVREKAEKVKEANISWDNVQAMIEADRLLAERLQEREQEELTDEHKARLFVELLEKIKKHFAALIA
ncbi:hypothetical protein Tco_1431831 [Tanacetum coccineum]